MQASQWGRSVGFEVIFFGPYFDLVDCLSWSCPGLPDPCRLWLMLRWLAGWCCALPSSHWPERLCLSAGFGALHPAGAVQIPLSIVRKCEAFSTSFTLPHARGHLSAPTWQRAPFPFGSATDEDHLCICRNVSRRHAVLNCDGQRPAVVSCDRLHTAPPSPASRHDLPPHQGTRTQRGR